MVRRQRSRVHGLLLVVLVFTLAACAGQAPAAPTQAAPAQAAPTQAAPQPAPTQAPSQPAPTQAATQAATQSALPALRVGFIVDQTGALAAIGAGYIRGNEAGAELWNADPSHRKLDVRTCDSQSTGEGALTCYRQFQNAVDVISGPHLFVGLAAIRSVATKTALPLISTAPLADPPADSYMFQILPTIDDGVAASFAYYKAKGKTRIATLTSNDQPGNLAKQAAEKPEVQQGLQVVRSEVFDPQGQNYAPQAENIAAAKPDAVIAWTAGPQLVTALRALKAAGVSVPIMLNYASMVTPLLQQVGQDAPAELLFFATKSFDPQSITDAAYRDRVTQFVDKHKAKYNQVPDLTAFGTADVLSVIGQAGKDSTSADAFRSSMESGKPFLGAMFDSYAFDKSNHIGKRGAQVFDILRWQPQSSSWTLVK